MRNDFPMIEAHNISMKFNLANEKVETLKEYVVRFAKHKLTYSEFYALKNLNFMISKGDSVALIGDNGCGKSTLLKIIAGVFYPTNGHVVVRGKIAPLIELGAGFDGDLTARENIFMNGAVLGYDRQYMNTHFNEIVDFAELWDFLDVPVKNFSSGMTARLGFSIATMVDADILVVDEVLAVGDFTFQKKCHAKMKNLLANGKTLLFVSHNIEQVREICKTAIWIQQGQIQAMGDVVPVSTLYLNSTKK